MRGIAARNIVLGLIGMAGLLAGCRTINRRITEAVLHGGETKQWQIHYGSAQQYKLGNEGLDEIEFEGSIGGERISVRYQRGLQAQAQDITDRTADLVEQVEQRIGAAITTNSTIHLLRFDETPQNYNIRLTVEPNEFPWLLFVRAGEESYPAILAENPSYPYLFVHELVETSLVCSPTEGRLLPDLGWGALGLRVHLNNYTRWFREGLANYAGYVAHGIVSDELAPSESVFVGNSLVHTRPFSSLNDIRGKLFSWPQSPRSGHEREYYSAALGLFLLLAERFGDQAIRDVMTEVTQRDDVDGHDLLEITNRTIGTDVKKLVADFQFPGTGLQLVQITPALALNKGLDVEKGLLVDRVDPNSPGDRAGLHAKDVILTADSTVIVNELDFELALFRANGQKPIPLTVRRTQAQAITIELARHYPEDNDKTPGKRRNPLKKGRIDVLGSFLLIP